MTFHFSCQTGSYHANAFDTYKNKDIKICCLPCNTMLGLWSDKGVFPKLRILENNFLFIFGISQEDVDLH